MPSHNEYIKNIEYYKKYYYSDEGKTVSNKAHEKYDKSEKGKLASIKYAQSEKGKETGKRYRQTKKGKISYAKHNAKHRAYGFTKLFDNPFDESELIEWHHITDEEVVALPKNLHQQYMGKLHREKTMEIVKQIYSMGQ